MLNIFQTKLIFFACFRFFLVNLSLLFHFCSFRFICCIHFLCDVFIVISKTLEIISTVCFGFLLFLVMSEHMIVMVIFCSYFVSFVPESVVKSFDAAVASFSWIWYVINFRVQYLKCVWHKNVSFSSFFFRKFMKIYFSGDLPLLLLLLRTIYIFLLSMFTNFIYYVAKYCFSTFSTHTKKNIFFIYGAHKSG